MLGEGKTKPYVDPSVASRQHTCESSISEICSLRIVDCTQPPREHVGFVLSNVNMISSDSLSIVDRLVSTSRNRQTCLSEVLILGPPFNFLMVRPSIVRSTTFRVFAIVVAFAVVLASGFACHLSARSAPGVHGRIASPRLAFHFPVHVCSADRLRLFFLVGAASPRVLES